MNTSTELMSTLAWSLLHFLWQGAAIAALAAAVMFVFRAPATRYLVGVASIALMFVSFGVTFASLNSAASDAAATGAATPAYAAASPAAASDYLVSRSIAPAASNDELAWVAQVWLAGVCLLALRIAFGLLFLERLRRRNLTALPAAFVERCRRLQQRLGISRVVRYCECRLVSVPAVIGLFRPVVLLPIARTDRPHADPARGGDRARARSHQAVRCRRQLFPGDRGDAVLLPSRGLVAQQAHPRRSRRLLR